MSNLKNSILSSDLRNVTFASNTNGVSEFSINNLSNYIPSHRWVGAINRDNVITINFGFPKTCNAIAIINHNLKYFDKVILSAGGQQLTLNSDATDDTIYIEFDTPITAQVFTITIPLIVDRSPFIGNIFLDSLITFAIPPQAGLKINNSDTVNVSRVNLNGIIRNTNKNDTKYKHELSFPVITEQMKLQFKALFRLVGKYIPFFYIDNDRTVKYMLMESNYIPVSTVNNYSQLMNIVMRSFDLSTTTIAIPIEMIPGVHHVIANKDINWNMDVNNVGSEEGSGYGNEGVGSSIHNISVSVNSNIKTSIIAELNYAGYAYRQTTVDSDIQTSINASLGLVSYIYKTSTVNCNIKTSIYKILERDIQYDVRYVSGFYKLLETFDDGVSWIQVGNNIPLNNYTRILFGEIGNTIYIIITYNHYTTYIYSFDKITNIMVQLSVIEYPPPDNGVGGVEDFFISTNNQLVIQLDYVVFDGTITKYKTSNDNGVTWSVAVTTRPTEVNGMTALTNIILQPLVNPELYRVIEDGLYSNIASSIVVPTLSNVVASTYVQSNITSNITTNTNAVIHKFYLQQYNIFLYSYMCQFYATNSSGVSNWIDNGRYDTLNNHSSYAVDTTDNIYVVACDTTLPYTNRYWSLVCFNKSSNTKTIQRNDSLMPIYETTSTTYIIAFGLASDGNPTLRLMKQNGQSIYYYKFNGTTWLSGIFDSGFHTTTGYAPVLQQQ